MQFLPNSERSQESTTHWKANILAIDDNPVNLHLLTGMLSEQGYKVRITPSGKLALKSVLVNPPDLILLDILMPGIDGYEVCQKLKADERTKDIPVIFISALTETFDKVKAFEVGGVDYITKPFQPEEVVARVDNQLRLQWLSKQLIEQNAQLCEEIQEHQQAREAPERREQEFRTLVENAPDAIMRLDREFRYLYVNPTIERQLRISSSDIIGKTSRELGIAEALVSIWETAAQQAFDTGVEQSIEYEIALPGGVQYFSSRIVPELDREGSVRSVLAIARDITDRKQAEEALRESETRYRELVESQDEVLVCRWNPDTTLTFVNQPYCRFFGKSSAELVGRSFLDLLLDERTRERVREIVRSLLQSRHSETSEHIIISATGEQHWFRWTEQPIFDRDGQLIEFQSFGIDITDRKQGEVALAQSEQKYRALVEASQDLIWSMDVEGRYTFVNPAAKKIYGYEPEEMLGRPFTDFVLPEQIDRERAIFQNLLQGGSLFQYETSDRTKDGKPIILMVNAIALRDSQGNVIGTTGTASDITNRKQVEAALRQSEARSREKAQQLKQMLEELKRTQTQLIQAEKMSSLGRMIAGVAHEINNPVSFIWGNLTIARQYFQDLLNLLELYQQAYPTPTPAIQEFAADVNLDFLVEDWCKLMKSIEVGAERIHDIVRSLKLFSRLDESEFKLVDIHEGIDNTLLILQHRLKAVGDRPEIQVVKNYGQLPLVNCHLSQLNQVFMNLINNAIDALDNQPEPRIITINTEVMTGDWRRVTGEKNPNPQYVVIRIADNGSGMIKEVLNKMFDPFFTTKPVGSGTGLGLSISHQIVVEKHQGQIRCVSTPKQGTEFIIEIPL